MTATDTGAANEQVTGPLSDSEAEDIFLKRFSDAEKPSGEEDKTPKGKEDDEAPVADEADADTSAEDQPEETDEAEGDEEAADEKDDHKGADEDAYVKIKVGEEEHEVPVKDLKRLYGQEAALTKKSMEVAQQRKTVDDELNKASVATAALLDRAKARFQPYSQIDFMLAAKELPAEEYQALKAEALKAFEDVQFLEQNLNQTFATIQQKQHDTLIDKAKKTLEVLGGPVEKGGIPGWSEKLYGEIRAFAVSKGVPEEELNTLVETPAFHILHDAMLYNKGKSKVLTKKVNKTPKKVIKTSVSAAPAGDVKNAKVDQAMKRLRQDGNSDAATEVFMARWAAAGDNE